MNEPTIQQIEDSILELSAKDRKAVQKCQRNGLLLGSVLGIAVHALRQIAFQFNKIKKPTAAGNAGAFAVNVILGYVSYAPVCAFKVLEPLVKEQLAQKQHEAEFPHSSPLPKGEENPHFQSPLNLDLDGPDSKFSHLSLNFEPNLTDRIIVQEEEEVKPNYQTTYEDLRKQNRESYRVKNLGKEGIPKPLNQPVEMAEPPQQTERPKKRVRTNQYGDPLD